MLRVPTGDQRTLVFFDGTTVEFHFAGKQNDWVEDELQMIPKSGTVPVQWTRLDDVQASVYLAKIWNKEHAIYAGWGVEFQSNETDEFGQIVLKCRIRCSDNDGEVQQVGYHVVAVGILRVGVQAEKSTDYQKTADQ